MVYLCLMSWCAQCIVFSGLVLCIATLGAMCGALYYYWVELDDRTKITPQLATYETDVQNANICLGVFIFFCVCEFIVTCMSSACALRSGLHARCSSSPRMV